MQAILLPREVFSIIGPLDPCVTVTTMNTTIFENTTVTWDAPVRARPTWELTANFLWEKLSRPWPAISVRVSILGGGACVAGCASLCI